MLFSKIPSVISTSGGALVTDDEFIERALISVFVVVFFLNSMCVFMRVSNLVSCRIPMSSRESRIFDKVWPIKYNS